MVPEFLLHRRMNKLKQFLFERKKILNQRWWYMLKIPEVGRPRQETPEHEPA